MVWWSPVSEIAVAGIVDSEWILAVRKKPRCRGPWINIIPSKNTRVHCVMAHVNDGSGMIALPLQSVYCKNTIRVVVFKFPGPSVWQALQHFVQGIVCLRFSDTVCNRARAFEVWPLGTSTKNGKEDDHKPYLWQPVTVTHGFWDLQPATYQPLSFSFDYFFMMRRVIFQELEEWNASWLHLNSIQI